MLQKKFTILLIFMVTISYTQSIKRNVTSLSTVKSSVLSEGDWYKFAIDTTGVFKIDKKFLQDLGVDTDKINPKNIKIFGNGGNLLPMQNNVFRYDGLQENAIFVKGEEDNSFDTNDYVLFYGKGAHSWKVNTTQAQLTRHENNIYSDKAYYFLTIDNNSLGKRIVTATDVTTTASEQITTYNDYLVHEIDAFNRFANGQQWFGHDFSTQNTKTIVFDFENLDASKEIHIRVRGIAISSTPSDLNVTVNEQPLTSLHFAALSSSHSLTLARTKERVESILVTNSPIKVELSYNNNGNPSARGYLDYVEVIGEKKLVADGKQFSFRNFSVSNLVPNTIVEYTIENSANIFQLWNVTDFINPKIINNQSSGNNFKFKSNAGSNDEYIVLHENDYFSPEIISKKKISNQNLHSLQDIDYIIVSPDFLLSEAERLALYHRENSNLSVKVVDLKEIYNEFGSGSPDLTAIRDFVRHLYGNATSLDSRIKFVCLFGDSSYDFKDRINNNTNIIPAFESFESFDLARSFVTDDYYGMMDEEEGDLKNTDTQDVATGRFPVKTLDEAKATVDKTLSYYATTAFGDWRNKVTLVADDSDVSSEFILQQTVERIADTIKERKPIFNITKIYADAFVQETSAGGERYPDVNEAIDNAIESGTLVIDYFGHGGEDGWAGERILEVSQIQNWRNPKTLPLMITVTCEFSRFDNPSRPTAGEFVFLNKNGGATSLITTTREVFITTGQRFNEILIKKLFNFKNEGYTIAQALMQAKNDPSSPSSSQRLFIFYLGDPAMKLAQPKPNIKLTKINGVAISQSTDTIKALSKITLEGVITDQANTILTDFNGTLSTTVFDKSLDRTTLDNNHFGNTLTFDAIESKIFRGQASVKNGIFSFEFIAPKDIRIAYGKAKISFYADNQSLDKTGVNQEITIGGINENAPEDNKGPTVKLFMDDTSFADGGNTSKSPNFIAILEDESGINTSITAVDHDIIAVLDGDQANPFILNDFYQTEIDNFTKGKLKFPFRNLKVGQHTLQFKCWDTYNNLSEATLNFNVVDDSDLVLSKVLNYPNPFISYTEFWFNHNKPNEPLEVQIMIYTVSGKLIKTISQLVQSENLSRSITWNGLDDFGNKIGKGVYIYKLKVKSTISNTTTQKIEKLVILR